MNDSSGNWLQFQITVHRKLPASQLIVFRVEFDCPAPDPQAGDWPEPRWYCRVVHALHVPGQSLRLCGSYFGQHGAPVFWRIFARLASAGLRVNIKLITLILKHFWIWFPTSAETSIRPGVLVTHRYFVSREKVRHTLASRSGQLMWGARLIFIRPLGNCAFFEYGTLVSNLFEHL